MRTTSLTRIFFVFVLLLTSPLLLPASEAPASLIVRLKPSSAPAKGTSGATRLTALLQRTHVQSQVQRVAAVFPAAQGTPLERCYVLTVDSDAESLLRKLAVDEQVEYVQLNHRFEIHEITPDDSLFSEQWGLQALRAPQAWAYISEGEPVPVAVIDTGVDYLHPDLEGQLWINSGEDLNGNGRVDETDFNGIDDDGNGFVDDIRGWDFTDAPSFIDSGDYADRDNDPDDEHGHGTAVTGIIVARANNGIGIAGTAFQNRVMVLRAGTSLGFLEEDDVAAAIVYAVANGARVINMSFGDVVVSPMLRDVIRYAWSRGVVLVASSGNSSSDQPHYPSGFQETISVGALAENELLAGFSNFGTTLDVVAPGQNIPTLRPDGRYGRFAGTSAAAPFISAAVSLILRNNPDFGPEQVRSVLTATARDLGDQGWDRFYGAGLPDLEAAVRVERTATVALIEPAMDSGFAEDEIAIIGTVTGAFAERFELSYGMGDNPDAWLPIAGKTSGQVVEDTLALWDVSGLADTVWTLRLQLFMRDGSIYEDKNRIYLDRTAPVIGNITRKAMLDGDHASNLLAFETDDITAARIYWRPAGSQAEFAEIVLNYVTRTHRFNFSSLLSDGREVEFYLWARNRSGLVSSTADQHELLQMAFTEENLYALEFASEALDFPTGLLLDEFSDFDGDGDREVLMSLYDAGGGLGPLAIYEMSPAGATEVFKTEYIAIPRDIGDSDGDGLREILAGSGPVSLIYEAVEANPFPTRLVWSDSADFWASRFADTDKDGISEIIGRQGDLWQVREYDGAGGFVTVAELPNPTSGRNLTGVPHAEIADFDGDGRTEILLGDYDGDIYLYEYDGDGGYTATWSDSLPLFDTVDFIASGDFDGDGIVDFAAAAHSDPSLNSESEFDARHWLVRLYRNTGDNRFEISWQKRFYGFYPPGDFDAGLSSGDVDTDGRDELLISLFPDLYVVRYQPAEDAFSPVWHFRTVRSNTVIVDTLFPGQRQMIANTDQGPVAFSLSSEPDRLQAPVRVSARPVDARSVLVTWKNVSAGNLFRIFRGNAPDSLVYIATRSSESYTDTAVVSGVRYFYAVTARDSAGVLAESRLSLPASAVPGPGPELLRAEYIAGGHVQLLFSEPLAESARRQGNYRIEEEHPLSVVLAGGGREVLLTFADLTEGSHVVRVHSIVDRDQTPINPLAARAEFYVPPALPRFYLTAVEVETPRRLALRFNQPVDPATAAIPAHYSISEPLVVSSVSLDALDPRRVQLFLSGGKVAALGREYLIRVDGVASRSGVALRKGEGDEIGFTVVRDDLSRVFAYPNPFRAGSGRSVTIAGLPRVAHIQIFDEHGRLIRELVEADGNGGVLWDGRDKEGNSVPSGVYLVRVRANSGEQFTKIAVVR